MRGHENRNANEKAQSFVVSLRDLITQSGRMSDRSRQREKMVLLQLEKRIQGSNRPRLVLDCSDVDQLSPSEIQLLLACLERVMKDNGDARLAAVSPAARQSLSCAGVDHLFRIFASRDEAVRSFESHSTLVMSDWIGRNGR